MAYCQPSTLAKAHRGSSSCTTSSATRCATKQSVRVRDDHCPAIHVSKTLIRKEVASWAASDAFPPWPEGRHPHCHFRGLLKLHSTLRPARSLSRPSATLSRGSSPSDYP